MGILETECERAGSAKDLILDILSDEDSCISFPGQLIETLMYNWKYLLVLVRFTSNVVILNSQRTTKACFMLIVFTLLIC